MPACLQSCLYMPLSILTPPPRVCGQYFMVSIVAQLHARVHLDIYMLHINHFAVYNPDVNSDCKRPMRYPFLGCFLGANVAVQYLSVRVQLGGDSCVIAQKDAHCARTVHPSPQDKAVLPCRFGLPRAEPFWFSIRLIRESVGLGSATRPACLSVEPNKEGVSALKHQSSDGLSLVLSQMHLTFAREARPPPGVPSYAGQGAGLTVAHHLPSTVDIHPCRSGSPMTLWWCRPSVPSHARTYRLSQRLLLLEGAAHSEQEAEIRTNTY